MADLFTAGVSFRIHFSTEQQTCFIHESRSTSYLQKGD